MQKRRLTALTLLLTLCATRAAALSDVICTGDCDYDHTTTINELVTGVNIALEQASIDTCRGFDPNGDGAVSVGELVGGVRTELDGCPSARLARAACDFTPPQGQNPATVDCGSVIVQEDRSRNDGRTVRIPFIVLKATDPHPAADPIVYLHGGPGKPILDLVRPFGAGPFAPFQAQRDLVFFDQRGTARSEPSLDCPEWRDALSTYLAEAHTVDEDAAALLTAMRTCHDRLMAEGVNFAAYTSAASAHDLEDLMIGLGYQQWNVYGASYGTRLGLTAMRDTPEHIRSVALDSTEPVQANMEANFAADFERSLDTLFAGCVKDAACNAAYPNLEETFFDLVAQLNANPITLHPRNPATDQRFTFVVTGDRLLLGLQQALYNTEFIPFLPLTIANTAKGDYGLLTAAAAQIEVLTPPLPAWGMYYSVKCNEEVPFITPEIVAAATAGVREEIKKVGLAFVTQLAFDDCAFWASPPPAAIENEPVVSDIPALVLIPRLLGPRLTALARKFPVVTVTGPRQSGKTTLCRAAFPDKAYVSLEAPDLREYALRDPRGFLADYRDGAIFDEVQRTPALLSYLQGEVDERRTPGRYVLTGSANFALLQSVSQSLAGRTALLQLLPLGLAEVRRFSHPPDDLFTLLWTGGYPAVYDRGLAPADWFAAYVGTYVERDVRQLLNVTDLIAFQSFLRLGAGRTAQLVNTAALGADAGVTHNTARAWLTVLEASYVAFRLPPLHRNLRKRLVKTPKLHFYDSGLLCYLLGITRPEHLREHPLRGAVFESWVVSEIVKARANAGLAPNLSFYRDRKGTEVDAVLDRGNELVAVETKSGQTVAEDFFTALRTFAATVGALPRAPKLRSLVVYGGSASQRRSEGDVVPWSRLDAVKWA